MEFSVSVKKWSKSEFSRSRADYWIGSLQAVQLHSEEEEKKRADSSSSSSRPSTALRREGSSRVGGKMSFFTSFQELLVSAGPFECFFLFWDPRCGLLASPISLMSSPLRLVKGAWPHQHQAAGTPSLCS